MYRLRQKPTTLTVISAPPNHNHHQLPPFFAAVVPALVASITSGVAKLISTGVELATSISSTSSTSACVLTPPTLGVELTPIDKVVDRLEVVGVGLDGT